MPQESGIQSTLTYIQRDISEIKTDMKSLKDTYASKEEVSDHNRRLDNIEANIRWVVLTVLGAVITGAVAILLATKGG